MKISVVTACYNSAATMRFTLDSFLGQTHEEKELLIVDGGSTDETVTIARSYEAPDISIVSEADEGIYDAMNKGLDLFSGDAVGFLNSDDRYADRHCLTKIASALEHSDITYGHLNFVADHECRHVVRRWRASHYRKGAFRRGWMPAHPTFYMRREVASAVGRFDVRFGVAADYDYMLRAFELHAYRSAMVNCVLVEMQHGGASTRSLGSYLRSNLESYRSRRMRLGASQLDPALFAKPLRKLPQIFSR